MEKRSRSDVKTDYDSWSKHKLNKELRNRGIAVATDRDKCIRRLVASDRGEPVPLALGKGPELQIVSEPVKIINMKYMDAEKPFYGIPAGILRMICYYLSFGDLQAFGSTCKFIYLECFRPVLSVRLYCEIANAPNCKEKDKNTFIQIMNREKNRPVLTPKALAYFLYIVSESKQGVIPKKFYSEFTNALKIWGSIDAWKSQKVAVLAEMLRENEFKHQLKIERVNIVNSAARTRFCADPFVLDLEYSYCKFKFNGKLTDIWTISTETKFSGKVGMYLREIINYIENGTNIIEHLESKIEILIKNGIFTRFQYNPFCQECNWGECDGSHKSLAELDELLPMDIDDCLACVLGICTDHPH